MEWYLILMKLLANDLIEPTESTIIDVNGTIIYDENIYKMEKDFIAYHEYRKDQYGLGYKFEG